MKTHLFHNTQLYTYRILSNFRSWSDIRGEDEWAFLRDARVVATSISTSPNATHTNAAIDKENKKN